MPLGRCRLRIVGIRKCGNGGCDDPDSCCSYTLLYSYPFVFSRLIKFLASNMRFETQINAHFLDELHHFPVRWSK